MSAPERADVINLAPGAYSLGEVFDRAREHYWALGGWDKDPEPSVHISFKADGFGTDVSVSFTPREGEKRSLLFKDIVIKEL